MTAVSTTGLPENVDALEYPTRRDEAWRYAPHDVLRRLSFQRADDSSRDIPAAIADQIPALDGPRIVIVNGVVDPMRSDLSSLPGGLQLASLADAHRDRPDLIVDNHDHGVGAAPDAFMELNRAITTDGAAIRVAAGHTVDAPIHIVDVALGDNTGGASCSQVMIRIDDGASATVVETRLGAGGFGGSNTQTTISLGDDASLDHIVLQDVATAQVHLGHIDVTQGQTSTFRGYLFNLGGNYGRVTYDVHLAGQGATADLSGLYFGTGDQTLDQQITVIHGAKNCTSRQSFRGVLDESSTGVFNGGIDVRPGADGTDAEQANNNLLLSDRAEANTQPRLEILADDVMCKHGATVGQLDDDAIYYLRTRGISQTEARRLLVRGFAYQIVDAVQNETVQDWIGERIGDNHE